jgi:phytoene synthase
LCCLRVWGCRDEAAKPYAIDCGLAFQLTNILRDLAEDAAQGRVYLPRDELQQFGYSVEDLRRGIINREFLNLMAFEAERAWACYRRAEHLMAYLPPPGQRVLRIMLDIYGGLLHEMERRQFDVFTRRIRLPVWKKCWFTARGMWGRRRQR